MIDFHRSADAGTRRAVRLAVATGLVCMAFLVLILRFVATGEGATSFDLLAEIALRDHAVPRGVTYFGLPIAGAFLGFALVIACEGVARLLDRTGASAEAVDWGMRAPGVVGWSAMACLAVVAVASGFFPDSMAYGVLGVYGLFAFALPFFTSLRSTLEGQPSTWRPRFSPPGWRAFGLIVATVIVDFVLEFVVVGAMPNDPGAFALAAGLAGLLALQLASFWLGTVETGLWIEGSSGGATPAKVARLAARWRVLAPFIALSFRYIALTSCFVLPFLMFKYLTIYDLPQLEGMGRALPGAGLIRAITEQWLSILIALVLPFFLTGNRLWVRLTGPDPSVAVSP